VWNVPPSCSTIWCIRPLGSVSCTWSPAANGPHWVLAFTGIDYWDRGVLGPERTGIGGYGGSDAGEDLVEVAGGEHADDLAGRVDQQVLRGRGAADRVEQRHALQVRVEYEAGVDGPGLRARVDPGPALRRGRHHGGFVDDRDRLAVVVDHDDRAGARLVRPPDRLRQRGARGHRDGLARQAAGLEGGQPLAELGGLDRLAGARPHEPGDDHGPQRADDVAAGEAAGEERDREHPEGQDPADPGGGDGGRRRLLRDLPDDGPEHAAAVKRQAREQVEEAYEDVGHHQLLDYRAGHAVRHQLRQAPARRAEGEGQRRARARHGELAAGGRRLPLDLGDAAERVKQDAADWQAVAPGHDRMRQFVHEHGEVEQDDEGGGDHVPRAPAQRGGQVVGVDDDEDASDDEP